ncbi:MAG: O-succinylhomoserine sulfhydrylase [Methylococcales bacterium]|jgi:O-succinylhomoserine sulfhydrylase|nr:O-succinylhomoserine sulfhydrylase [Methylococcales bacterium]MBT7408426.1 O-succinylhomoserine sulfhydrylase [Methylococcales bacterium]
MDAKKYKGLATTAIRTGHHRTPENEHSDPIFLTSSYVFENAETAAAVFAGDTPGNIYSRFTNPTVQSFEKRLAAMEGGERCVATASGMSAILSVCMGCLKSGDHIVVSQSIFGTTTVLFNQHLTKFGIETTTVELTDIESWQSAIRDNTRLLFLETPSNPLTELVDIKQLAELAHDNDCLLVIDNCFCTPILQRPLELGADIVVHSVTKYIDGQGRCMGGAIIGSEEIVGKDVYGFLRTGGPTMSAFNAWVFIKGLETLSVRIRAQCESAMKIAQWLEQHEQVNHVYYPGLTSHPQHELATQQQTGYGAIVAFEVGNSKQDAWDFINRIDMISITANLGDVKTTLTHPASTTHGKIAPELRVKAGIQENLLRLSIGLEDVEDLITDLSCAFNVD